jgi:hypothetical protein
MSQTHHVSYAQTAVATGDSIIRPFRISFPDDALADLRQRIAATIWPEKETALDATQGVQLATMQKFALYWQTEYDWRKIEARPSALPNFKTEIGGLDIHFIRVRSQNENAMPLIVTRWWPGSIIEPLKIIDPLTNPTAHGAHFAAREQPVLYSDGVRAGFRYLRGPT